MLRDPVERTIMTTQTYYFAQAYGTDAYGSNTYQCSVGQVCDTATPGDTSGAGTGTGGNVAAPNTGFLGVPTQINNFVNSGPQVIIPSILIAAVLIAVLAMFAKRLARKRHTVK